MKMPPVDQMTFTGGVAGRGARSVRGTGPTTSLDRGLWPRKIDLHRYEHTGRLDLLVEPVFTMGFPQTAQAVSTLRLWRSAMCASL